MYGDVTPVELKAELEAGKELFLLDVREPHELEISKIDGIVAIPMGEVPARMSEIPKDADIVVICRSGGRSGTISEFLTENGYTNVRNMVTGMNGYVTSVDPSQPTY